MRAQRGIVSVALLAVSCGCTATPAPTTGLAPAEAQAVNAGMELRLQVGQTAPVDGAEFQVTFDAIEGDSRCPKGVQCVWEGSATVRVSVTSAGGKDAMILQTSPRAGPVAATYEGWAIRVVALEPQPIEGREIAQSNYLITLRIERGSAGPPTH